MIDRDQVRKVAKLARLDISPEEEKQLASQMNDILAYFEQLGELDVTEVSPTARAIDTSNVTRPDQLQPYAEREAILEAAPDQEGNFFKVPQILG